MSQVLLRNTDNGGVIGVPGDLAESLVSQGMWEVVESEDSAPAAPRRGRRPAASSQG